MNSNQSRPVPPANTGSKLLDFISDTALAFIQFERRFDPFFRPAFDAAHRAHPPAWGDAPLNGPGEHRR